VPERPGRAVLETLGEGLADRELLIVLDNCEHLIEAAAALVSGLLARCARVSVLATSREPLRIAGEHVYRVPSLSTPDEAIENPDRLAQSEAVGLFVDRAAQQRRGFALDHENATVVARVCRRLDGIPLAIELAAVRLRSLSIGDLDARLDQRFALLRGGSRTALPRQQTLLALIEWSYQLLSEAERDVLARLSVFAANGLDLDAAEAVCCAGGVDRFAVLDHLDALVNKSLVQAEDASGRIRYRLLETLREYAAVKLSERGGAQAGEARLAHRDHYLALAEAAHPHLRGPDAQAWLERLAAEHDNLRTSLSACLRDADPAPGLRLGIALAEFWRARDHPAEGAKALGEQLERPDTRESTLLCGYALAASGRLLVGALGNYPAAITHAEEALGIARAERDDQLAAQALQSLAWARLRQGDLTRSLALNAQGTALARSLGDQDLLAQFATGRGVAMANLGRDARPAFEEALDLSRRRGDRSRIAIALGNIGYLELVAGDPHAARTHTEEAVRIFREVGDVQEIAAWSMNLGFVCYVERDRAGAALLFTDALAPVRRGGDPELLALALLGLALTSTETETAAALHGAADAVLERLGFPVEPLESRLRETDHARLQDALGDARFASAYKTGHELPRTDAIALARRSAN
jgi:predicted ATPase